MQSTYSCVNCLLRTFDCIFLQDERAEAKITRPSFSQGIWWVTFALKGQGKLYGPTCLFLWDVHEIHMYCGCRKNWRVIIAVPMNFLYISHHFTAREDMKSTNWPRSQCVASQLSWSSIAPDIAEVTGSNPVEALIFFRLLHFGCLNLKIYCDDHSSLSFSFWLDIFTLFLIVRKKRRSGVMHCDYLKVWGLLNDLRCTAKVLVESKLSLCFCFESALICLSFCHRNLANLSTVEGPTQRYFCPRFHLHFWCLFRYHGASLCFC